MTDLITTLRQHSPSAGCHEAEVAMEQAADRIAELEAAIIRALKHADGNGMGGWPVFVGLRKALKSS